MRSGSKARPCGWRNWRAILRLTADMGVSVGRAVPVEVLPAGAPASAVELTDAHLEIGRVIGPGHRPERTPDRQLPAHIWLDTVGRQSSQHGVLVQGTPRACGMARPIEENAGAIDDLGLADVVLELGPVLEVRRVAAATPTKTRVMLPLVLTEFGDDRLDPLHIVLVREMRAEGATAVVRSVAVDARTARAENARPTRRQPRQVDPEPLVRVGGVRELGPRPGPVGRSLRHGDTIGGYVDPMRLGVIDVGSNTVHLLVVDAHRGGLPIPATSHKVALRLSEHVDDEGRIDDAGARDLAGFVGQCLEVAEDQGVEELMGFVTSAIREAPNGDEVLALVKAQTGVVLDVLSGEDEARLTFLATRRWFGWSSGRLLMADIGGGSLELAVGTDEDPRLAPGRSAHTRGDQGGPSPDPCHRRRAVATAD